MACTAATTSTAAKTVQKPRSWADIVKGPDMASDTAPMPCKLSPAAAVPAQLLPALEEVSPPAAEEAKGQSDASAVESAEMDGEVDSNAAGNVAVEEDESLPWEPLMPGARGSRQCPCRGEVLAMLGHYGWIRAFDEVDHPEAWKNGGRVYVSARDVEGGVHLQEGDVVDFCLYADRQGLGAEACRLWERRPGDGSEVPAQEQAPAPERSWNGKWWEPSSCSGLSCTAKEFVPSSLRHGDEGLEASQPPAEAGDVAAVGMNPDAPVFVPSACGAAASAPQQRVPAAARGPQVRGLDVLAINAAYLSEDSDDETSVPGGRSRSDASGCEADGEISCAEDPCDEDNWDDASCEESFAKERVFEDSGCGGCLTESDGDVHFDPLLDVVVLTVPLKSQRRATSPDGSTSAGEPSDSEDDGAHVAPVCAMRPPPGLSVLMGQ